MRARAPAPRREVESHIRKMDFHEYFLSGPKVDDFEIERGKDTGRKIDLGE